MTLVWISTLPVQGSYSDCLIAGEPKLLRECLERLHGLTDNHLLEEVAVQNLKFALLASQDDTVTYRYCKQSSWLGGWLAEVLERRCRPCDGRVTVRSFRYAF